MTNPGEKQRLAPPVCQRGSWGPSVPSSVQGDLRHLGSSRSSFLDQSYLTHLQNYQIEPRGCPVCGCICGHAGRSPSMRGLALKKVCVILQLCLETWGRCRKKRVQGWTDELTVQDPVCTEGSFLGVHHGFQH